MSRALLAAVALLAAAPARGYVRSADDDTGACLYWGSRQVPWVANAPGGADDGELQPACGLTPALDAVRAGFGAWSGQACTDLALVETAAGSSSTFVGYRQSGGANENLVVFRRGWCTDVVSGGDPCWTAADPAARCDTVHNCFDDTLLSRGTLALTTVTYSPSTGRIVDADMEVNAWDGDAGGLPAQSPPDGWYFTCLDPGGLSVCATYGQDGCYAMDLRNTVTHEVGHFIGLAHPCEVGQPGFDCTAADQPLTMYPRAALGEIEKRTLHADDVEGLCDIYPAGAATSTCVSSEESSGCGCGTASPTGALAALLGLVALAPRLRRRGRAGQDTSTPA